MTFPGNKIIISIITIIMMMVIVIISNIINSCGMTIKLTNIKLIIIAIIIAIIIIIIIAIINIMKPFLQILQTFCCNLLIDRRQHLLFLTVN